MKLPPGWICLVVVLVILVLFCDCRFTDTTSLLPNSASKITLWKEIEPPDTRIRMLWILHSYVPFVNAGSEVCAHTINKYFLQKPYQYDIWVAAPGYPKLTYEGIRCFDLYDSSTFLNVVNSSHVLHSHSYIYRQQLRYLCRKRGIPFVEWVHTDNYVRSIPNGQWIDRSIEGRHWTVFNSKSLRDSRWGDIVEQRTHIVHPPVDYREYRIGKEDTNPVYVTLSNVNENKGGNLLVALAKALPDFQFLGVLGGYRTQIVEHGLPNLRYVPNTVQMKDIYAQTWVQIMPSKEETWGRTAVEAMSSGIPVLAHPTPGLRECCDTAALYCNRNDLSEWIEALQRLRQDKEWYNQRSTVAFDRARVLDPKPELEGFETWIQEKVLPSAEESKPLQAHENILLFR